MGLVPAASAPLPCEPVAQLAEGDHAHEHQARPQHQQDDLFPLLRRRLFDKEQVKDCREHGENLAHSPTTRSAKLAELLPNSHQP